MLPNVQNFGIYFLFHTVMIHGYTIDNNPRLPVLPLAPTLAASRHDGPATSQSTAVPSSVVRCLLSVVRYLLSMS